ncbi:MAG TPA: hypothetical protein VGB73_17925 [Pyrinomonadaceae bacterium]|jgi:hypothetical protein
MAFKVHTITRYNYSFDARLNGPGSLQLWSDTHKVLEITFVEDNAAVTAPTLAADLESAKATFKSKALAGLVDMLRNESPVKVTINNQAPGFVYISAGLEAVGEGES